MITYISFFLIVLGVLLTLFLGFPGIAFTDSILQYLDISTNLINEWQSPFMTWLWKVMESFSPAPLNIFLFQLVLFAGSLYLWWKAFKTHKELLLGTSLLFLTPPIFISNAILWKDTQMVWAFFLAISAYLISQDSKHKKTFQALSFTSALYACSVRYNAAAVLPPLLFFLFKEEGKKGIMKAGFLTLLLFIGSLSLNRFASDRKTYPSQTQKGFDLVGIEAHGGRVDYPDFFKTWPAFSVKPIVERYTPDGLNNLYYSPDRSLRTSYKEDVMDDLNDKWMKAILENPMAYLAHKKDVFVTFLRWDYGSDTYYSFQLESSENPFGWKVNSLSLSRQMRLFLWPLRNSFFYYPWIWLIFSFLPLFFYVKKRQWDLGFFLLLSGYTYLLGFFFVLPASDYRYFLWTYFTIGLSSVWIVAQNYKHSLARFFPSSTSL